MLTTLSFYHGKSYFFHFYMSPSFQQKSTVTRENFFIKNATYKQWKGKLSHKIFFPTTPCVWMVKKSSLIMFEKGNQKFEFIFRWYTSTAH